MPSLTENPFKLTQGLLYGKGVFTTIAILDRNPFSWEKHWLRLRENAERLGMDLSGHLQQTVLDELHDRIVNSGLDTCRARITFHDKTPSFIWATDGKRAPDLSIVVAGIRPIPENLKLTISPHRVNTTSPLAGIKSCNYLEPILSLEEAKDRGFDEAIRLNERGEIASACMANVFWLKDNKLFTPNLRTGCLAGTTRECLLENLVCEEVETGIDAVREADEIFLTSAGLGVVQAASFEGRSLARRHHKILELVPRLD